VVHKDGRVLPNSGELRNYDRAESPSATRCPSTSNDNLQPATFNLQPLAKLQPSTFNQPSTKMQPPTFNLQSSIFNLHQPSAFNQPTFSLHQPAHFKIQSSAFNPKLNLQP
jgi:hypothetical protein